MAMERSIRYKVQEGVRCTAWRRQCRLLVLLPLPTTTRRQHIAAATAAAAAASFSVNTLARCGRSCCMLRCLPSHS